jgi:hypothetical protein
MKPPRGCSTPIILNTKADFAIASSHPSALSRSEKEECNAERMFLASLGNKNRGVPPLCFKVIKLPSNHHNVSIPNPHSGLKLLFPSIDNLQQKSQCQKQ